MKAWDVHATENALAFILKYISCPHILTSYTLLKIATMHQSGHMGQDFQTKKARIGIHSLMLIEAYEFKYNKTTKTS